ncbi:2,3-bisphosphoglycerate-independent phosphoglycerate mutase [Helicobacter pylori]|uniref:2,3-bisphosphoglycerate-independent phosphoglycerate mutase n=1 Tax=Helicobacter pylori TaxID=210 RepID=UPI00025AC9D8|nr:2,3-bisphosphoglycerate-independent phosphoglycerate mutase [Helicobacter pylori]EIE29423.1 phosphoglyceromutase [Helicobacter pylori NCTC 11637 = CCUG 17874 = ATCC 43504 = JCM 12093]MBM0602915.1 2,3-bisphosphoglycerate-independent phosphoglycerate mutase [Helicobacter pylori]MBM0610238.1 2,3-bisphosphoglycerate-independent phosphoglycerate mutase [Helicobacter pylori]MBM0619506.1 2,3-bisphosphoglycerate-independent phosphoglycerate mutase [Helicobacter pylori]MBM0626844.1 2,3-bisphosphogly
MAQKTLLIITDGIGYRKDSDHNAFFHAKKPTYDLMFKTLPYSLIDTYGLSVGLPKGQMGNSEVGHMCIGAGRVLYQDLVKISLSLQNDDLKNNLAFLNTIHKSKVVHLMGLMSDGGVHSHIEHFIALALECEKSHKKVFLHLITDGRDVAPKSALTYLETMQNICNENIQIATISGRFYAMDRDNRFERIELAYHSLMGLNHTPLSPSEYIQSQYDKNITDEFIMPACFKDYCGMQDDESFIFINFRNDRAREIVSALGQKEFSGFKRETFKKLHIATMTPYDNTFPYPVLFPKESVQNTLAEVVSQHNLTQSHIAETEKYAHVTFFINGGVETPFKNENRVLIQSPKVTTYDLKPEMSAKEVTLAVLEQMKLGTDLIIVNFANGDMVGHTGNFEASIKAVEAVDACLGEILSLAKELDYAMLLTSDHGNCERMKDENQNPLTNHTAGSVYCFVLGDGVKSIKNGALNNIASSVLKLMGLKAPATMDEPLF